jgi:prepilin-type N-terminal cleavage/methylation domain-containing protein
VSSPLDVCDRKRRDWLEASRAPSAANGFTLVELLTVTAVIGIISAIAIHSFSLYREKCCVMAAVSEIIGMIKEAKQNALCDGKYYGVGFKPDGKVSLISGKGPDDKWNTADDQVVRSFSIADKGGDLRFSCGSNGAAPGCTAVPLGGISFQNNNTLVCNDDKLTGSAGAIYLISRGGSAMAIVMNSTDYGYKLWKWDGSKWVRL